MAEEYEKYAVMRNLFRRRSSIEFTGAGFNQVVEADKVSDLIHEMGSNASQIEVKKQLEQVDTSHSGKLTFEQYQKVCDQFVKDTSITSAVHEFKGFTDFDTAT
ncbi:hypothetical protein Ocin01_08036 [Orchesella cincta]|uniref:EF-hand domain-containing protein n=1 Tax=Orchesella cincta TaxID=48709 RepID=A0A1D2N014_ORCCI|nr:hypothetical protein Ocin01_08036 [Orchesella cincta]